LLISAGAGTGKTTTLCARVAWLVAEGASPERIMPLTFTLRAARETLQRTRTYVQLPAGSRVVLSGTFHSVAHLFVGLRASTFGLAPLKSEFVWTDENPPVGEAAYYYVRTTQSNGSLEWSSPVWVDWLGAPGAA
jgi:superfamily I DNA/RNA helicase